MNDLLNSSTGIVDNSPNASKVLDSLRYLDYTTETAILDIVDNAIDANATNIDLWIIYGDKSVIKQIDVVDNGTGMDPDTLNEAMKLGSLTEKNHNYELGKFGMGLVTSSISLGRMLRVITRSEDNELIEGVQDLDLITKENKFIKILKRWEGESPHTLLWMMNGMNQDPKEWWSDKSKVSHQFGTIVSISNIDKCEWKRADTLAEKMKKVLGQTFRKFIQDKGVKLRVFTHTESDFKKRINDGLYGSGKQLEVAAIDPINDFEPLLLNSAEISIGEDTMQLKVYELKGKGQEINRENGLNIANQGFYIIRNNREISTGETLGLFNKHNDNNLLRCELAFSGLSDSLAGTNFSKQKVSFNQGIKDKIEKEFNPYYRQIRSNAKIRQADRRKNKEDFSDIEKHITKKSHLLKNPKVEIEKRDPKEDPKKTEPKNIRIHSPRLNITKRKRIDMDALKVRFETSALGVKGPLWESAMEKGTVIVKWNVDHPFYITTISPNSENPEIFNPIAYLVYCWAKAELNSKVETDSAEIIDNIRWEVGKDLSILIGS